MDVVSVLGLIDSVQSVVSSLFGSHGTDFGTRAGGGVLGSATNLYFFYEIKEFINARVDRFAIGLLGRMMSIVSGAALAIMTMWVFWQGLRVMTGKSQESMMSIVMNSARAAFVLVVATTLAAGGKPVLKVLVDNTSNTIYQAVTGKASGDPYKAIDKSLSYMQLAMISIDALDVSGDENIESAKNRAQLFTGIGIAGPSLVGGTLLLLNRIAMALFIGFGPIFIMCLLFDQTKHLFSKWLLYGIGTMFSLAILSVMVSIALDVVTAVAIAFWVGGFIGGNSEGISSMALQQGGLGTIMTLLIITVPPMAASFFQGTLGQLSTVNMFGGGAAATQTQQTNQQTTTQGSGAPPPTPPRNVESETAKGSNAPTNIGTNNPVTNPRHGNPNTSQDVIKDKSSLSQTAGAAAAPTNTQPIAGATARGQTSKSDPSGRGDG